MSHYRPSIPDLPTLPGQARAQRIEQRRQPEDGDAHQCEWQEEPERLWNGHIEPAQSVDPPGHLRREPVQHDHEDRRQRQVDEERDDYAAQRRGDQRDEGEAFPRGQVVAVLADEVEDRVTLPFKPPSHASGAERKVAFVGASRGAVGQAFLQEPGQRRPDVSTTRDRGQVIDLLQQTAADQTLEDPHPERGRADAATGDRQAVGRLDTQIVPLGGAHIVSVVSMEVLVVGRRGFVAHACPSLGAGCRRCFPGRGSDQFRSCWWRWQFERWRHEPPLAIDVAPAGQPLVASRPRARYSGNCSPTIKRLTWLSAPDKASSCQRSCSRSASHEVRSNEKQKQARSSVSRRLGVPAGGAGFVTGGGPTGRDWRLVRHAGCRGDEVALDPARYPGRRRVQRHPRQSGPGGHRHPTGRAFGRGRPARLPLEQGSARIPGQRRSRIHDDHRDFHPGRRELSAELRPHPTVGSAGEPRVVE